MKEYFYDTISRCFDNVIYTNYGSVAVSLYSCRNNEGKDVAIKYVAYDIPNAELMKLSEEEQNNHIKVDKTYDISDINFNERMSVLSKINELVRSFEAEVYNQ